MKLLRKGKPVPFDNGKDLLPQFKMALETSGMMRGGEDGKISGGIDKVAILYDTEKVNLVPEEFYSGTYAEDNCALNNMRPSEKSVVVASPAVKGIVAVMNIPADVFSCLQGIWESRVEFASPLQAIAVKREVKSVNIIMGADAFYLAVYGYKLLFADAFGYGSAADVAFVVNELDKVYPLKGYTINISGKDAKAVRKTLRKYYRKVSAVKEMPDAAVLMA